jgi:DNA-binding beta-propeller fold protein YncE
MAMKIRYFSVLAGLLFATLNCSHNPVYPGVGSIYIYTEPVGVEILVDGQSTKRYSPAKIDNITIGTHKISLRYYRCKEWSQNIEIKAGQTKNLYVKLTPILPSIIQEFSLHSNGIDLALDNDLRKIYVANRSVDYLWELSLGDSTIASTKTIFIGSPQNAVVVNSSVNRGYALLDGDTISVLDLLSGSAIGRILPTKSFGIKYISLSADGSYLYTANYADSSISVFHVGPDTVIKTLNLSGGPSEVVSNKEGDKIYILFKDENKLEVYDVYSGAKLMAITTGIEPMGIFWSQDYQKLGVCNSIERTAMIIDPENLGAAISPINYYGIVLPSACLSNQNIYLWAVGSFYVIPEEPLYSGTLTLYYTPTWNVIGNYTLNYVPWDMLQSRDGRFLYILEKYTKDVVIIRTDIDI